MTLKSLLSPTFKLFSEDIGHLSFVATVLITCLTILFVKDHQLLLYHSFSLLFLLFDFNFFLYFRYHQLLLIRFLSFFLFIYKYLVEIYLFDLPLFGVFFVYELGGLSVIVWLSDVVLVLNVLFVIISVQ
jgi:hypothetical protein